MLCHCPKKRQSVLHVSPLSTDRSQISNIRYFSREACGKYFWVLLCPAEPIFYSPDVLSRIGGVAIGLAGRDHFNTRSRYKFRSLAGSTVWWPNKRPARVQLAKILASLISVTFPIATGVRCYCPIVQSSLNPLVLSDNHFQSPHFVPPPPAFHVLPQFSPIYTAVGFRV